MIYFTTDLTTDWGNKKNFCKSKQFVFLNKRFYYTLHASACQRNIGCVIVVTSVQNLFDRTFGRTFAPAPVSVQRLFTSTPRRLSK